MADDMKVLADNLFEYFEPKIQEIVKPYLKMRRALVTQAPSNGKISVQFPFDASSVSIPVGPMARTATVGDSVWVAMPYTDMSNAVAFALSDFSGGFSALDAWPVNSVYTSTENVSPATTIGGYWQYLGTDGTYYRWKRTAYTTSAVAGIATAGRAIVGTEG